MPPRGLPAAVALLREEVATLDANVDREAVARAEAIAAINADIAQIWQRILWLNKHVESLLKGKSEP